MPNQKRIREFIFHFLIMFILLVVSSGLFVPEVLSYPLTWIFYFFASLIYAFCHITFLSQHYKRVNKLWKHKTYRNFIYRLYFFLFLFCFIYFVIFFFVRYF
ncbi:MAG: hypothetical protein MRECE_4c021 [Mycoplasmataceae bacterium CE_OT135]|nr:MAG: hypothetical protein MRECE_4c021 [Mycoplasmataceae bacterium CE_OT135]